MLYISLEYFVDFLFFNFLFGVVISTYQSRIF